jgi:hypothetical protein
MSASHRCFILFLFLIILLSATKWQSYLYFIVLTCIEALIQGASIPKIVSSSFGKRERQLHKDALHTKAESLLKAFSQW